MGRIIPTEKAVLLIGAICGDENYLERIPEHFGEFGTMALAGPVHEFTFTHYYVDVMGAPLFRRFVFFEPGFDCDSLAGVKIRTNELEAELASGIDLIVERPLNLDPGYLTLSKLVLASTKNHAHRVYLRDGIYGEVTLFFRDGRYRAWPWTYPDYASEQLTGFFRRVRMELFGK